MRTITGERQSGKTTKAVQHALVTGAALICASEQEKRRIRKEWGRSDEEFPIFTVGDLVRGKARGHSFNGIVIDEGNEVFQRLLDTFIFNTGSTTQYVTEEK